MAIAEPESKPQDKVASITRSQAKSRARTRLNKVMKLVRRSHLYAGLFLVPWVLMYGVTALLFNHPMLFPDGLFKLQPIEPADLAGTPLERLPAPRVLAAQVVEALNKSGSSDSNSSKSTPTYRLVRPEEATFAREYSATVPGGDMNHFVRLDLAKREGTIRSLAARKDVVDKLPPPEFAQQVVQLDSKPMDAINQSLNAVLARRDLPPIPELPAASFGQSLEFRGGRGSLPREGRGEEAGDGDRPRGRRGEALAEGERPRRGGDASEEDRPRGGKGEATSEGERPRRGGRDAGTPKTRAGTPEPQGGGRALGRGNQGVGPELTFAMEGEGKVWRVGYQLQTGRLTGKPEELKSAGPPSDFSNRRFLLRLHTAHGYPSEINARWFWAIIVDVMAVCMIGWGITGLLMWWQMKNVRVVGAVVLVLSAVVSFISALGIHATMVAGV